MRHVLFGSLVTAGMMGLGATASAQTDVLNEFYGRGYHAYFRNDLAAAEGYLTTAITEGSKDPRAYYYRGLTYLCQGKSVEADVDFHDGALLEAEGHGRLIGQALDRIQGYNRYTIEKARLAARLEVARRRGFAQPAPTPRTLPPAPAPQPEPEIHSAPDHVVPPPPAVEPVPHESNEPAAPMEEPVTDPAAEPAAEESAEPTSEAPAAEAAPAEPAPGEPAPSEPAPADAEEDPFGSLDEPAAEAAP